MQKRKNIKVCFSADQFENYTDGESTVVIVDLLRATSVISTAFEFGIKDIIPVRTLEETLKYKGFKNHIIAAERNTLLVEGFKYGNSPYHYMNEYIREKTLVLTTTNGTQAIHIAKLHKVITASFINLNAVTEYLTDEHKNVIILCSGWKGLFNLEDTIFAGALAKKLLESQKFTADCDSLEASIQMFSNAKDDLFSYLERSSYRKRNSSNQLIKDTKFCLNPTINSNVIPIYFEGKLIRENNYQNR